MRGPDTTGTPRARALRRDTTLAESRLWDQLRARRLAGYKFVRPHAIGPYFADFACRSRSLVIEIDGATHSTPAERQHDARRTAYLQQQGYRVLRISNNEVLNGMDEVLTLILDALEGPSPPPG